MMKKVISIVILFFGIFIIFLPTNISLSEEKNKNTLSSTSSQHQTKFKLIKDLEIKSDEKDLKKSFLSPGGLEVDSEGNIYVLEPSEQRIQVFTTEGVYLNTIGRKGQGPGEFQAPYPMFMDKKDRLYVYDIMRRAVVLFNERGEFIKNIPLNPQMLKVDKITIDSDFNIICGYFPAKKEYDRYIISIFDKDFNQLKEIYKKIGVLPFIQIGAVTIQPVRFTPEVIWAMDDKDNFYISYNKAYEIEVLSKEGELIQKITKKHKPEKVTKKEEQEITALYQNKSKQFYDALNIPKVKPPILRLNFIKDYLFVLKKTENKKCFFDIFHKNGTYVNEIILDLKYLLYRDGYIYTIKINTDDRAGETTDIKVIRYRLEID